MCSVSTEALLRFLIPVTEVLTIQRLTLHQFHAAPPQVVVKKKPSSSVSLWSTPAEGNDLVSSDMEAFTSCFSQSEREEEKDTPV